MLARAYGCLRAGAADRARRAYLSSRGGCTCGACTCGAACACRACTCCARARARACRARARACRAYAARWLRRCGPRGAVRLCGHRTGCWRYRSCASAAARCSGAARGRRAATRARPKKSDEKQSTQSSAEHAPDHTFRHARRASGLHCLCCVRMLAQRQIAAILGQQRACGRRVATPVQCCSAERSAAVTPSSGTR